MKKHDLCNFENCRQCNPYGDKYSMSKLDELGKKHCKDEKHPYLDVVHIYDDGKKLWQCRKCGGFFPSGIPSEEYQRGYFAALKDIEKVKLEEREAMKKMIEGMKKGTVVSLRMDYDFGHDHGYNRALTDLLNKLQDYRDYEN